MSPPRRPRVTTVLFDFGDTLWHFPHRPSGEAECRVVGRRIRSLLSLFRLEARWPPAEINRVLLAARGRAEQAAAAGDLRSPDYVGLTRDVCAEAGLDLSMEQAEAVWESHNSGGPLLGRRLFDDAHETLGWLLDRGFRVGAVTNRAHGGESFRRKLHYNGLLDYFEVISSSDQVGWRKPHRALFDHATDALGGDAAECVMVGDRPDADVIGAREVGMIAVWMRKVTPPDRVPRTEAEEPHYTIDELSELRDLPPLRR